MKLPIARTVLLADDDITIRALVRQFLMDASFRVVVAEDGHEALSLFEREPAAIDVLITDLVMPNKHGVELARCVLKHRPTLPIIFISGSAGNEVFPTFDEFPDHILMCKPFLPSELLMHLARLLPA